VIAARATLFGALLALGVAVGYRALVVLIDISGARDQPALILALLLSAFLGVLVAVATRMLRLPGATAPTALVLGWILVPLALASVPSEATSFVAGDAALVAREALALVAATVSAAVTLGVPAER
jgi:NAD/NADP transhydrogenase beta subunit